MNAFFRSLVFILFAILCLDGVAQTNIESRKTIHIPKIANPPTIDGRLDDEMWNQATLVSDLHQTDPIEYSEAT